VNVRGEALEFLARHRQLFGVPLLSHRITASSKAATLELT